MPTPAAPSPTCHDAATCHDFASEQSRVPRFAAASLWASAFVLIALILTQAAGRHPGNAALAGDAANVADLAVLTASAGTDEDVLCILDQRNETLSVFGVEQGRSVQLLQVQDLRQAFTQARGTAAGR